LLGHFQRNAPQIIFIVHCFVAALSAARQWQTLDADGQRFVLASDVEKLFAKSRVRHLFGQRPNSGSLLAVSSYALLSQ
jgi:hypothetical protein